MKRKTKVLVLVILFLVTRVIFGGMVFAVGGKEGSVEIETFTLMVPHEGPNPAEMELFKQLEEITKVRVDWQIFPKAHSKEKKNLVFASGDYPDAMGGLLLDDADIVTYGPEGIFIAVEGLIDKYGPNILSFFKEVPGVREELITPDGHIYSFPLVTASSTVTKSTTNINVTWLRKLGLSKPTTTDEFYYVLKAFKEKDPNGNGKNDEIPWSFQYSHPNKWHANHYGSFGIVYKAAPRPGRYCMMKDKRVVFAPIKPEFKEGVMALNKLYVEGLIDPESFTQNSSQYNAKARQDPTIFGVTCHWTAANLFGYDKAKEHYEYLLPLKGPKGYQLYGGGDHSVKRANFAITSAAEKPEIIMRWLNELFEPEMSLQIQNGPLGITLDKRADGTYHPMTIPGMTWGEARRANSVIHLPYGIRPSISSRYEESELALLKKEVDKAYKPYAVKENFPPVWFTTNETGELNILRAEIEKFVGDNEARWIVGDGSVESEWDSYLNELQKMGVDKLISIYQAAVDRYYAAFK